MQYLLSLITNHKNNHSHNNILGASLIPSQLWYLLLLLSRFQRRHRIWFPFQYSWIKIIIAMIFSLIAYSVKTLIMGQDTSPRKVKKLLVKKKENFMLLIILFRLIPLLTQSCHKNPLFNSINLSNRLHQQVKVLMAWVKSTNQVVNSKFKQNFYSWMKKDWERMKMIILVDSKEAQLMPECMKINQIYL